MGEKGREYVVPLNQQAIKIYDRTRNKRIKKKQIKKAPMIEVRNEIIKYIRKTKKEDLFKKKDLKVYIGGKEVNGENKYEKII